MAQIVNDSSVSQYTPLPKWFRQELPDMDKVRRMKEMFRGSNLHTVCESARCPNIGKCWGQGVATFMILGEICTRACRFCAVKAGVPMKVDVDEPRNVARAVKQLQLRYVVITSVARDDLPDEGARQFAETIRETRALVPGIKIEILIPDFSNKRDSLQTVVDAAPEVLSHNIETVKRLSKKIRPQAAYERSLKVLENFKEMAPSTVLKSSIMLGLGEIREEVRDTMQDLLDAGCDILTIGQYLSPSKMKRHLPVEQFIPPEEFKELKRIGEEMGFKHVESGPLVRSSFIAEEGYRKCMAKMHQAP